MRYRFILAIALSTAVLLALGHDDKELYAQTQHELNVEADKEYRAADAELNKVYQDLRDHMKNDSEGWRMVVEAQRAWLKYRDLWTDAASKGFEGGSIYPMYRLKVLTSLTLERTAHLKNMWIEGYPGDEH